MKKCREVMTPNPVTCHPDDSLVIAARLMKEENVGPVPVVEDGTQRLLGILTDRDIVVNAVAQSRDVNSTKVKDVMTHNPITCSPEDSLKKAIQAMAENQIRRVPVVEKDGILCGIIAQADIAQYADEEKTGEVVKEISEPAHTR